MGSLRGSLRKMVVVGVFLVIMRLFGNLREKGERKGWRDERSWICLGKANEGKGDEAEQRQFQRWFYAGKEGRMRGVERRWCLIGEDR